MKGDTMSSRFRKALALLALLCLLLSGCSGDNPTDGEPPEVWGQTVSGRVTYNGESLPYGVVLFYDPGKIEDGKVIPLATAMIQNGRYVANGLPTGPVVVCVACDPDVSPASLSSPTSVVGGAPPGGPPGGGGAPPPPPGGLPPGAPPPPGGLPSDMPGATLPGIEKLSDEQKTQLKALHKEYGNFSKAKFSFPIEEGQQTQNLDLKD